MGPPPASRTGSDGGPMNTAVGVRTDGRAASTSPRPAAAARAALTRARWRVEARPPPPTAAAAAAPGAAAAAAAAGRWAAATAGSRRPSTAPSAWPWDDEDDLFDVPEDWDREREKNMQQREGVSSMPPREGRPNSPEFVVTPQGTAPPPSRDRSGFSQQGEGRRAAASTTPARPAWAR